MCKQTKIASMKEKTNGFEYVKNLKPSKSKIALAKVSRKMWKIGENICNINVREWDNTLNI